MGYEWGSYLFSSPNRFDVLGALSKEPSDTRELTDGLSASRVTVQRHLNACTERGWVEKVDGRYELTPVGGLVYRSAERFLDRLAVLDEHDRVVATFADLDPAFDPLLLADATVTTASSADPHAPISHYRKALSASETASIRGISPIVSDLFVEVHGALLEAGVDTELIMPRPVLAQASTPAEVPEEGFSLRTVESPLEFGITLTDDAAFVGRYEDGSFAACVENDAPPFRAWAEDVYERYRDRSTAVRSPGDEPS